MLQFAISVFIDDIACFLQIQTVEIPGINSAIGIRLGHPIKNNIGWNFKILK
jgi:hypothetical protein